MRAEPFLFSPKSPETDYQKDIEESLRRWTEVVLAILNGGLQVEENFDFQKVTITTDATPDTEQAVSHNLKRVPAGILVVRRDKAAHIYDGTTAWTSSAIYLRSDIASVTATIYIL